jgi:hypothetical protein
MYASEATSPTMLAAEGFLRHAGPITIFAPLKRGATVLITCRDPASGEYKI